MIPLEDESRRPSRFPVVTAFIIALNVLAFILELMNGDAFVTRWSVVPADVVAGRLTWLFASGAVIQGGNLAVEGATRPMRAPLSAAASSSGRADGRPI